MTIYEKIYAKLIKIADTFSATNVGGCAVLSQMSQVNLTHIRDMAYNIEKYNIRDIHNELLCLFIADPRHTFTKTEVAVNNISTLEYKYIKSYRSLIHVEDLLLNFIYLAANKEIYRNEEE